MLQANAIHDIDGYIWEGINPQNTPCLQASCVIIDTYHWKCSSNFLVSGIWHAAWTLASGYLHHFQTHSTLCLLSELLSLPLWKHRDPYGWIYCLTELNTEHNIHKIPLFQKDPNDSDALHIQSNWSRLLSLLSSFPITDYILHVPSLFPWQISELILVQPNPYNMSYVLTEFFMNPTLNLQALRCTGELTYLPFTISIAVIFPKAAQEHLCFPKYVWAKERPWSSPVTQLPHHHSPQVHSLCHLLALLIPSTSFLCR